MIGIDIVEIPRIQSALDRFGNRFTEKLFTPSEIQYCEKSAHPAQHYASHFAAKEAVAKIIQSDLGYFWKEIEISHKESGAPYVQLSKRLQKQHPSPIEISLTHTRTTAAAVAIRKSYFLQNHRPTQRPTQRPA